MALDGKEDHTHAILARGRQSKTEAPGFPREKGVRDLNQNARPVAGFRIAPACAAVRQVDEDLNPLLDNVVRFLSLDVGHETNAAGIVFMAGMIETLGLGQSGWSAGGVAHELHLLGSLPY